MIASKIEQDYTASHNEESASKERLAIGVTDSHNEKIYGSEISTRELLHEQLFSPNCFNYGEQVPMNLHLIQQKMMMTLM